MKDYLTISFWRTHNKSIYAIGARQAYFQLNPKAKLQFWARPDPQKNHRNFKLTNPKSNANRADLTPPPSNSVNAGGVM